MPDAPTSRPGAVEDDRARRVLQVVIDSIPVRVFWKDLECKYLGCNAAFARDAGLARAEDIVGRDDFELTWRASAPLYRADDREVMDGNRAKHDIDEPMTFPDGRTIRLRTSKVPLRDANGAVFGVLGTYEDVTDRRQSSLDLAESEERFRATFEQAAVGLAHLGLDGRWLRVNNRLCEMLGYTREELLARTFQDVTHPDDLAADLASCRRLVAGEIDVHRMEKRYLRKDGNVAWIDLTASLLRAADGAPKYFISVIEDIEPRRRAEEERRRLAEIVEQSSDAVMVTNLRGEITYVNPAFEESSGYGRGEVEGRNPRVLKSGRQTDAVYAELWETITRGGVWHGRLANRRRDGTLFEEEATIFPVRDPAGQPASFVAIKRDVTQEIRLREQLSQAQRMEAVGRLAGGVAHDFNNLLTAILGFADIVLADAEPRQRDALLQIRHAGERAAALTRQLLAFSRKQVFQLEVLDLGKVVSGMAPILRRLLGEDVLLEVQHPDVPALVRADASQVEQVVLNLAVNARDAMPDGGLLRLEVALLDADRAYADAHPPLAPGRHVQLVVSDNGSGMDEETQKRVFEPFFTTKPKGQGTGLGLATVYGIVQQSGGSIGLTSEPQRGTTFRVALPRIEPEPPVLQGPRVTQSGAPAAARESILVAEDDAGVREFTRCVLEASGYRVLCADSGATALELLRRNGVGIDLVVSDVVMPEMGGRELQARLRQLGCRARVLFMSGYTDDAIAHHGALEEGVLFLQKPFTPAVLARCVREALDGGPSRS